MRRPYSIEPSLSDMPPLKREELIRDSIRTAHSKLEPEVRKEVDLAIDTVRMSCEGTNLGPAGALELIAKLGMLLNSLE